MDDLGSSVSRSSFAMMILTPHSLGKRGEESKYGKKKKYDNKFNHI